MKIDLCLVLLLLTKKAIDSTSNSLASGLTLMQWMGIGFVGFISSGNAWAQNQTLIKEVTSLLESRCTKCHSSELAEGDLILTSLQDLKKRRNLINLSNPEKSELIKRISKGGGMPKGEAPLSEKEVKLFIDWIQQGAPDGSPVVDLAKLRSLDAKDEWNIHSKNETLEEQILRLILNDLSHLQEKEGYATRYLTLTHFWVAGESEERMEIYRTALSKLLNSLSRKPQLVKPVAIDKHSTILRFNLDSLGWDPKQWNDIVKANPFEIKFASSVAKLVYRFNPKATIPYLRGDWFAFTVSRAPFYEEILGLPKTSKELEKQLGIDVAKNIKYEKVARAGFLNSDVSQFNRVIERHETEDGAYWRSYDFNSNSGLKDIFKNPFSNADAAYKRFEHGGGEVIFNLPNGLQGYWLEKADGARINIAPTEIVSDKGRKDNRIFNGISCMGCHTGGLHVKFDKIREHTERSQRAFAKEELEKINRLYKTQAVMAELFKKDIERYQRALDKLGIKESGKVDNIRQLVDRFEGKVDLNDAASEFGISVERLKEKAKHDAEIESLVNRLENEGVSRESFISDFDTIARALHLKERRTDFVAGAIDFQKYFQSQGNESKEAEIEQKFGKPIYKGVAHSDGTVSFVNFIENNRGYNEAIKFLSLNLKDGKIQEVGKDHGNYESDTQTFSQNGESSYIQFSHPYGYEQLILFHRSQHGDSSIWEKGAQLDYHKLGISRFFDPNIALSNSGKRALLHINNRKNNQKEPGFVIVDLEKGTQLLKFSGSVSSIPALSPKGDFVAFVKDTNGKGQVSSLRVTGKEEVQILDEIPINSFEARVAFSSGGKFLSVHGPSTTNGIDSSWILYDFETKKKITEIHFPKALKLGITLALVRENLQDAILVVADVKSGDTFGLFRYSLVKQQLDPISLRFSPQIKSFGIKSMLLTSEEKKMIVGDSLIPLEF